MPLTFPTAATLALPRPAAGSSRADRTGRGCPPEAARGAHLLDAARAVVADAWLAGLTVRAVAARAGTSPAQVQDYFRTATASKS